MAAHGLEGKLSAGEIVEEPSSFDGPKGINK